MVQWTDINFGINTVESTNTTTIRLLTAQVACACVCAKRLAVIRNTACKIKIKLRLKFDKNQDIKSNMKRK